MVSSDLMQTLLTWYGVVGIDVNTVFTDLSTLVPYVIHVSTGMVLTGLVFGTVVKICKLFTDWRWR